MSGVWAQAAAVALGGAAGALLRFAVNMGFMRAGWGGLPMATLAVNVAGCFLAGLLLLWIEQRTDPVIWRALLMTGLLGAVTTFSALGVDLWQLQRDGRWDMAALLLAGNVVLGVLAVGAGHALGRQWWGGAS